MKMHWFPRFMWGKMDKERPLPLPTFYGVPSADVPQPRGGQGADFIGGADGYWCQHCFGTVKIRHQREALKCPNCHKTVVYVAGEMGHAKTDRGE